jgi:2-dehydro-3-deoxygalactonokinase
MNNTGHGHGINICLDVGITQTRAWAMESGWIVAQARTFEGIRGSIAHENRSPALDAIRHVIAECLKQVDGGRLDSVLAAGMATSELGPFPLSHIASPAGLKQLSDNVVQRSFPGEPSIPLFLVPGIRFGTDSDSNDAIRGEETLIVGLLAGGRFAPGDALLNLGSHWKLIRTNPESQIIDSFTGNGGELMMAISRETILKSILPKERPHEVLMDAVQTGRDRSKRYGLARTLFLSRMDTQRNNLTSAQTYWQVAGALIEDALVAFRPRLSEISRLVISGHLPLSQAWAAALCESGIESRVLTEEEVEQSFCIGLNKIVSRAHRASNSATDEI